MDEQWDIYVNYVSLQWWTRAAFQGNSGEGGKTDWFNLLPSESSTE